MRGGGDAAAVQLRRGNGAVAAAPPTDVILSAAKDPSSTARVGRRLKDFGIRMGCPRSGFSGAPFFTFRPVMADAATHTPVHGNSFLHPFEATRTKSEFGPYAATAVIP